VEATETSTRALTIDEAIALAIQLQRYGELRAAQEIYRHVLDLAPDHPDALHFAGVLAHQQGQSDTGIALIERSLAIAPGGADGYSNLGLIFQSTGRLDEATEAYRRAIAIDPAHANAHSNLGVLLRALGQPAEAEAAYRTAIQLNPEHIDAYTNLGILLNSLNRPAEAAACFSRVITLRPKHRDARKLLALAHCTLGEVREAIRIFDEWLQEEPDDPVARHMRAACTGEGVPARASDGFIERTFDSFATSFESKLARLSYRAPALVAAMLEDAGITPSTALEVLDAGCGTGLCGPLVAPYARRMTGVDLSDGMLAQAAEKQVYDVLLKCELTEYLKAHPARFDLIVSADALVYFGDLEETIRAAAHALRPAGLVIFTLEHLAGGTDHRLEMHGRYSHSRDYVERLLTAEGLAPAIAEAELRMEAGVPVAGLVVRARKPAV
jgi:predicted TPR repeat methyltransferase